MRLGDEAVVGTTSTRSGDTASSIGETFELEDSSALSDGGLGRSPRNLEEKRSGRRLPNRCTSFCGKRELPTSLGPDQLGQLALVTHLNVREIRTIDTLFCLLVELSQEIGEHVQTRKVPGLAEQTPRANSAPAGPADDADRVWTLSARQLRRLPEFSQNVFLERFIRVVSETGEDSLTLLELIDLYSALSRRASFEWKAWILFCVLDYDEDGMLDSGDIYRTIRQMIVRTRSMRLVGSSKADAAILIQKHYRGRHARKRVAMKRANQGQPPLKSLGRSLTFTEAYTRKILNKCQSVQQDVMDFRYFEHVLRKTSSFEGCFSITMCKPRKIEHLLHGARIEKVVHHEQARMARIERLLGAEKEGDGETESIDNPLHEQAASSGWDAGDALARRVKRLDRTVEKQHVEHDLKLEDDDYDTSRLHGGGIWKPYGDLGAESAYGMRPPILATRLRWVGMDMRMLRMLSGRGSAQEGHLTTHTSDHVQYEAEGVEQILHEFAVSRKPITTVWNFVVPLGKKHLERLHHSLWGHALADISHKHGYGIMELASIMKWMLLLNFALGAMWMALVVVPRDFDSEESVQDSVLTVLSALVINGSDTQRNLFYDGFKDRQGALIYMDLFYFTAIIATIVISLASMLYKLGTVPMGGNSDAQKMTADAGVEWATILGSYDFTQVDYEAASKMRQGIRGKLEDWHADLKETLLLESLEHATWTEHVQQTLRLKTGSFMTNLLLVIYAIVWFWMLNNQETLKDYHVLLAPAILASLNASSPPIIKFITLFEHRAKSIDVMETCVKRIFRVKVVQLLTIYYTIFKIMSGQAGLLTENANANATGETIGRDSSWGDGLPTSNNTVDVCPEARSGAIFLHQLLMDAVVFITIQYSYLYMVKVGFPNLFVWRSTVTSFGKGSAQVSEKSGYRLQRRMGDIVRDDAQADTSVTSMWTRKTSLAHKKEMRWYKLEPHNQGRWYKQGLISILLENYIHQATCEGTATEDAKYQNLVEGLSLWRKNVARQSENFKMQILGTDTRSVSRKALHLGLLDDANGSDSRSRTLKDSHAEVKTSRRNLTRTLAHQSEVFSSVDLDSLSDEHLLDTCARANLDDTSLSDFREKAHRFKQEVVHRIEDLPDDDPDSAQHSISGRETTEEGFVRRIENSLQSLAQHVCKLEQADDETIKSLLAARPRHREPRRCCSTRHKATKATKLRLAQRDGETADQYKKRKNVISLLKADVQYAASEENQSPLHEMRSLLTAIPARQLSVMVETIHEIEGAKDRTGILTDSISLDQASSWRYHRFYLNQSIKSWVAGITIPTKVVVQADGEVHRKQVEKPFNSKTQEAITDALAKQDIHTVGEMLDSELDDRALQQLFRESLGEKLPKSVLRRIRKAQGEWTDVTAAVAQKRWIRMPPTELKHDESASLIIGMLWRQVFVWAGTAFCPWLPLIACALQILMFTALQQSLLHGRYNPPKHPWAAGATTQLFMRFGMLTLLLCVVPITMWLNGRPSCGPHAGTQIASTYSRYEQEVLIPYIDEHLIGSAGSTDDYFSVARQLYNSISFVVHYLMNSTFLLLIVFVMWTRGHTRQTQLVSAEKRLKSLKKQMKLDAAYLQSRLRDAKKHDDPQVEMQSLHLEQQKMHKYIMATIGVELKAQARPGSAKKARDKAAHDLAGQAFKNMTTRTWPVEERHGLAPREHRKHMPIIWLIQDTSVVNFTQFTVRVNDEVVVQPKLQRNDLCGEVRGQDHVLVLEFDMPADTMGDTGDVASVKLTITAPDAGCGQKMQAMALPMHPVPDYQYSCVLTFGGTQHELTELQEFQPEKAQINGISFGEVTLGQERWAIRVPVYREVPKATDKGGNNVSAEHVCEFQVELLRCTVENKAEPFNEKFSAEALSQLSHKQLLKKAASAGVDADTIVHHKDAKGSTQTEKLIEAIVQAEENRPKKKNPTPIARHRIAMQWHRYSHFVNLYNALATCVGKKQLKQLPPAPIRHHEHMHLFHTSHQGRLYEERRKNLEAFMQRLLECACVCAYVNPYVLGFLGIFTETGEEEEDPYWEKTRYTLRQSVHKAALEGTALETIRELDHHATHEGVGLNNPDSEAEPNPGAEPEVETDEL